MNHEPGTEQTEPSYEPPQIESVMTAEELAREIQYAGDGTIPPP